MRGDGRRSWTTKGRVSTFVLFAPLRVLRDPNAFVSPRFDGLRSRQDVDLLWRLAARTDSRIEPVPCGERQWQEDTSSPIIEIARREGERVAV